MSSREWEMARRQPTAIAQHEEFFMNLYCRGKCYLMVFKMFKILETPIESLLSSSTESNIFFNLCFPGAIFEQGTDEVQSAFKFAMLNHNLNVTGRRFELQAYVDLISTADAFKLSRLSK